MYTNNEVDKECYNIKN